MAEKVQKKRFTYSIRQSWYGLIILVGILPTLTLMAWGSYHYYDLLLSNALQNEQHIVENLKNKVDHELFRLTTLLENKSDPIAYTLARKPDQHLLNELLLKIISRESAVHALFILNPEGNIIAGRETYEQHTGGIPVDKALLMEHWSPEYTSLYKTLSGSLSTESYVSPIQIQSEGVFFDIAILMGTPDQPIGTLLATIDASIMWKSIKPRMLHEGTISYLVDSDGNLLYLPTNSGWAIGDLALQVNIVEAYVAKEKWQNTQIYQGLYGNPVFGTMASIEAIQLGIISEVSQEQLLASIWDALTRAAVIISLIIFILVWIGLVMVNRLIKPIREISTDFNRVAQQDYTTSTLDSPLKELSALTKNFNHMVTEIEANQHDLRQAAAVFQSTSEGVIITDAQRCIIAVNKAFSRITGYTENEVLGCNPAVLQSKQYDESFYQKMWGEIEVNGQWHGEIWSQRKNGEIYPELLNFNVVRDNAGNITHHVGVFSDISTIKETEEKLFHQAHHDPLTELPNRLSLNSQIKSVLYRAESVKNKAAIFFLDLDRFKNINDSMGHNKGDRVLKQVAHRIEENLGNHNFIARLGGDEFVLVAEDLKSSQDAASIAQNILNLFMEPFHIDEKEIFIDASIGISLFPKDGEDSDTLLSNADTAMFRAKEKGRNNYQFYTAELTDNAVERLSMETYLHRALEKNELILHYQPQFALQDGQLIGFEALIRWQHPKMGMIPPDKFIQLAEETGLIIPIGEWVLRAACTQHQAWVESGFSTVRMAVNLSALQFQKLGLSELVSNILEETGMQAKYLDLELTESIIMRDTESTIRTLHELDRMGVSLSIDDFGTGYSSLSYIKRFPICQLKIDRSFVSDIPGENAEMIVSIIALAHSMNLKVIAEGVETKEQLNYLIKEGCDEVQGFLCGRPMPAEEVENNQFEAGLNIKTTSKKFG